MEQQNLAPKDLIPYLGSRSRVSEILSKKRPLTISMIRSLNVGLGIPADVLIQESQDVEWYRFPIDQMIKWGWITPQPNMTNLTPEKLLRPLFENIDYLTPQTSFLRSSSHIRSKTPMDEYALRAWLARVLTLASKQVLSSRYEPGKMNIDSMKRIAQLSESDNGPLYAIEFLKQLGIRVVVERHLPQTYLDGAAITIDKTAPVIGLTIRHDRIDNFWFTLMHELAHIVLHSDKHRIYYDDLDIEAEDDPREREANELASEALIPNDIWKASPASRQCTSMAVEHLASKLHISPAIVAGKIHHESECYNKLQTLVGFGEVRKLFPAVQWEVG